MRAMRAMQAMRQDALQEVGVVVLEGLEGELQPCDRATRMGEGDCRRSADRSNGGLAENKTLSRGSKRGVKGTSIGGLGSSLLRSPRRPADAARCWSSVATRASDRGVFYDNGVAGLNVNSHSLPPQPATGRTSVFI